ncbi:MAG: penicillin acylase family protein [Massilia sp.]|nr:penicillin acylase family protein [Massilia sp.]
MNKRAAKTWSVRILFGLLGLVALLLLVAWLYLRASMAQLDGTRRAPGLTAAVTVARDDHGAPLLQGSDRVDLAYATGFVHAQDRFFQMDLLRRVGAGELAELFGARAVPADKVHRLHRFRARAEAVLLAMPADDRRFIERYAAGINDGLGSLGARPFEYALTGTQPRPWTAADSLLVVWAMFFDLQGMQEPRELARGWIAEHTDAAQRAFLLPEATEWDAPLDQDAVASSSAPIPPLAPRWWGQHRAGAPVRTASADFVDSVGSNNWAVAGSRSQGGGAIVSDDMHLGLQLPITWYRLALQFPDADGKPRRIAGITLPGAPPVVTVGSNGHVAWGYTNAYGDFMDLVALETDSANPARVRTPAGWETLARIEETILVKGAPAEKMSVRESSLGPLREAGGRTYAIHWIAHLPSAINLNHRKLETTDTLEEALSVAATIGIPAQNFVAGDDKGSIGWTITGMLPHREQAAAAASFPIAPGSATLTWDRPLAPADYPRLLNPAEGQLSTANSRQLMGAGADVIGDGGFDLGARNHQVRDGLRALGTRADVKSVYAITLDDRAIFMARWRTRAIAALDAAAVKDKPQRAEFLRLLNTGWSGRASVESTGYRLSRGFMWALHDLLFDAANGEMAAIDDKATMQAASTRWPVVVARLLDEKPAGWLPAAYPDWRQLQLAAIDQVIAELTHDGKPLAAATWGARNTAAIAHPISMAVPALRRWLSAPADQLPGDSNMPRVAGPKFGQSQRMTVTPGKEEQGIFNMPGGQSGHPLSPFFLRGHAEWVAGTAGPLLPGPAVHTLRFEK